MQIPSNLISNLNFKTLISTVADYRRGRSGKQKHEQFFKISLLT